MTLHHRHLSAAEMKYGSTQEQEEFPSFARNATMRASTGNLKQPRLPGSEKFKFARSGHQLAYRSASTLPRRSQLINGCTGAATLSSYAFGDSRRKPILPISRNTSRVLNNTNVELTADTVEIIHVDNVNAQICNKYLGAEHAEDSAGDEWSRSSSDQSLERGGRASYRHTIIVPQRHSTSDPAKTNPALKQQQQQRREVNNNNNNFATIRSSRFHSTRLPRTLAPSTSQSTISSDEDIWVLRS